MSSTDEGVQRIEQVDSPSVWGPCGHPDATKLLLSQGEERPVTRTTVEPQPGVEVVVEYFAPDAPVIHVVATVCAECGGHEVWETTGQVVIDEPAPLPPPPPTVDVCGMTCRPAPEPQQETQS